MMTKEKRLTYNNKCVELSSLQPPVESRLQSLNRHILNKPPQPMKQCVNTHICFYTHTQTQSYKHFLQSLLPLKM